MSTPAHVIERLVELDLLRQLFARRAAGRTLGPFPVFHEHRRHIGRENIEARSFTIGVRKRHIRCHRDIVVLQITQNVRDLLGVGEVRWRVRTLVGLLVGLEVRGSTQAVFDIVDTEIRGFAQGHRTQMRGHFQAALMHRLDSCP
jgi:hypothetical protein